MVMKKILIVGDDYVGSEPILKAFARFQDAGYELVAYDWLHGGIEVLSEINRHVELEGPESPAAPVPDEVFCLIQDASILIVEFLCVPKALIDAAPISKRSAPCGRGSKTSTSTMSFPRGFGFSTPPAVWRKPCRTTPWASCCARPETPPAGTTPSRPATGGRITRTRRIHRN